MRLHRTVAMAIQRHTASQRYVRMNTEPAPVRLPCEDDRSPARTVDERSIFVKSGARPGRDGNGHGAIGAVSFAVQSALLDEGSNKKRGLGWARLNLKRLSDQSESSLVRPGILWARMVASAG